MEDADIEHALRIADERAERISPLKSTLSKNIIFTMHQDSPVIKPDMAETLQVAMQRKTRTGISMAADEAIKLENAIRALTYNCAYQYFEEEIILHRHCAFCCRSYRPYDRRYHLSNVS